MLSSRLLRPRAVPCKLALRTITFTHNSRRSDARTNDTWLRSPKDVAQHLDRYIIGQERAKKILAVAVFNHYHRILEAREREEVQLPPPANESDGRSRGRKRRKDDSADERGQEDSAEIHELIKVNRDPDPTMVHEIGSWQGGRTRSSDEATADAVLLDRYRDPSANEVALDDADAPPTLLGRVSKRMFNQPSRKARGEDDLEDVTIEKSNVLMV